jgi:hypothetical protein
MLWFAMRPIATPISSMGILIDLATATNVLVATLNLILVLANGLMLSQILSIRWSTPQSPSGLTSKTGYVFTKRSRKEDEESVAPLPIRSASDQRIAERERTRREADTMEELVTPIVEKY